MSTSLQAKLGFSLVTLLSFILLLKRRALRGRASVVPKGEERVVVLGSTSGIGRSIALQYAKRGARVCLVGRRTELLQEVQRECLDLMPSTAESHAKSDGVGSPSDKIMTVQANVYVVEDMVRVRETLKQEWQGVDTVIMSAGVSSLRPLMEAANVHDASQEPNAADIQQVLDMSNAAFNTNMNGPLVCALALIPLLQTSSRKPAIALISSAAAMIPAPTRSLYCASKAASLFLYEALAIEHPGINFTCVMPSTVDGDFRTSAVDGGEVREADPDRYGMKREYVAQKCINGVDKGLRNVFLPWGPLRLVHFLYWTFPSVVEYLGRRKYRYTPPVQA